MDIEKFSEEAMRSKIITIFLVLSVLFCSLVSFSGCASKKEEADVHVFYYTYSDPYISTVRSALDRALDGATVKYQDHDGNNNQTTQTEQIQTAITKGAKLLVVNIVTTGSDDAANGIVTMAKEANIPVIFFNREVSDSVVKSYEKCVFIGTDAA
jgi:methyl-galactoside transport system substrate-binding protein